MSHRKHILATLRRIFRRHGLQPSPVLLGELADVVEGQERLAAAGQPTTADQWSLRAAPDTP